MSSPESLYETLQSEAATVVVGNEDVLKGLTVALLTRGHVLLEGVPGVAKTTLANVFARATGLEYNRIQMTPDMVPADITGTTIYRAETSEFVTQRGPVFSNVVVADEINRATPKTQSALLEAMEEQRVTIEGETLDLPSPFIVVATQNPIEMEGVFNLPEAQRDRFQLKYIVDLPSHTDEREILDRVDDQRVLTPETVEQVITPDQLTAARDAVADVHVASPIKEYVLSLIGETRSSPDIRHGASPRASIAFLQAGKAVAAIDGRDYVIPADIKTLAKPVLRHRLVRSTDAELANRAIESILDDLIERVETPEADASFAPADTPSAE